MGVLRKHKIDSRWSGIELLAKFVALIVCVTLTSIPASSKEARKPILVQGKVDSLFYDRLEKSASLTDHIVFSSTGGDVRTAMKIARYLQTGKILKTSVGGLCLSACADILLPAAMKFSDFSFVHKPLIGFHHNSEIIRRSLRAQDAAIFEKCWGFLNSDFIRFLDDVGRSSGSINSQMTALAVVPKSSVLARDCSSSRVSYARKYWFPTSKQLNSLFTVDGLAPVCADDESCFGRSLLVLGKVGDRFLVGSTEYTVVQPATGEKTIHRGETFEFDSL